MNYKNCISGFSKQGYEFPLFLIFACLVVLRFHDIWLHPRFWGEEASVYFSYALTHSTFDSLTKAHQSYYNLFTNAATWLATQVPLATAPYITQIMALTVELLPIAILAFGHFTLFPSLISKIIAASVITFVTHTDEIWLNSITSHCHFLIATFLLLIMETPARRKYRATYVGIFAVAGLSSVSVCMLIILALWKAWSKKTKTETLACLALAVGCAVQIYTIVSGIGGVENPRRPLRMDDLALIVRFLNQTVGAIWTANPDISTILLYKTKPLFIASGYPLIAAQMTVLSCLFLVLLIFWRGVSRWAPFQKIAFAYGIFIVGIVSIITSLDGFGGLRYTYVPNVLLLLVATANFNNGYQGKKSFRSILAGALICWALCIWVPIYFLHPCCYSREWPLWSEQVALYKSGEISRLLIHPPPAYLDMPTENANP